MASVAARLNIADIAHRSLVTGLVGLSLWGTYGIYALHTETLRRGLIAQAEHDAAEALKMPQGFSDARPDARP
ncbi:hypothetical protein RQP46_007748 [Phenoliferia psychrophenolica]